MKKPVVASLPAASLPDASVGFTQSIVTTGTYPPVATFRQYLDGPAEAFEQARRTATKTPARPQAGSPSGAPQARYYLS